jgi:hypothetical protein
MPAYYLAILVASLANLVLAAVAYVQRAKQIRGNKLREQQLALAEARNELAERRLGVLHDQVVLLSEIRDALGGRAGSGTTMALTQTADRHRAQQAQFAQNGDASDRAQQTGLSDVVRTGFLARPEEARSPGSSERKAAGRNSRRRDG